MSWSSRNNTFGTSSQKAHPHEACCCVGWLKHGGGRGELGLPADSTPLPELEVLMPVQEQGGVGRAQPPPPRYFKEPYDEEQTS
eukprot:1151115-Pelagomonas_calceolata.AAC.3